MAKRAAPKPCLHLCAAAWTMTNTPSAKRPWSWGTKVRKAEPRMQAFAEAGAVHVNVQLCDHDTPTEEALPVAYEARVEIEGVWQRLLRRYR